MSCAVVISRRFGGAYFEHLLLVGVAQGSEGLCSVHLSTRPLPPRAILRTTSNLCSMAVIMLLTVPSDERLSADSD